MRRVHFVPALSFLLSCPAIITTNAELLRGSPKLMSGLERVSAGVGSNFSPSGDRPENEILSRALHAHRTPYGNHRRQQHDLPSDKEADRQLKGASLDKYGTGRDSKSLSQADREETDDEGEYDDAAVQLKKETDLSDYAGTDDSASIETLILMNTQQPTFLPTGLPLSVNTYSLELQQETTQAEQAIYSQQETTEYVAAVELQQETTQAEQAVYSQQETTEHVAGVELQQETQQETLSFFAPPVAPVDINCGIFALGMYSYLDAGLCYDLAGNWWDQKITWIRGMSAGGACIEVRDDTSAETYCGNEWAELTDPDMRVSHVCCSVQY